MTQLLYCSQRLPSLTAQPQLRAASCNARLPLCTSLTLKCKCWRPFPHPPQSLHAAKCQAQAALLAAAWPAICVECNRLLLSCCTTCCPAMLSPPSVQSCVHSVKMPMISSSRSSSILQALLVVFCVRKMGRQGSGEATAECMGQHGGTSTPAPIHHMHRGPCRGLKCDVGTVRSVRNPGHSLLVAQLDHGTAIIGQQHLVPLLHARGNELPLHGTPAGPHSQHHALIDLQEHAWAT